ncbi:SusC/RagA family TonB-linked outer membrane protein [Niabella ginsengisoli]|uniref:TonB-dependent receptor n=1 Tax=Niabella ginsengisoli TaxID=522298 RepID=A0ABS9SFF4_9BACT|nr:TonB-dependent receptor [Niabella ginsengisoli]MCH5597097.1 TonB-dependent receptor [Niabella ginsengisoli]
MTKFLSHFLVLFCTFLTIESYAQTRAVNGKVADAATGSPLSGATISVKESNTTSVADANGDFTVQLPSGNTTLIVSFVGYDTKTVNLDAQQDSVNVLMSSSIGNQLSDVVVVGYGTQKRSDLTGAITTVKASELTLGGTVSNVGQALRGKAAGVQVMQNSNAPGGSISIKVRGPNSINSSNEPLYVVDGMPTTNGIDINPNDIESMDILKDASAAAIYGARGANGVVIITTKRGKTGKPQISYNGYYGVQGITDHYDMLSGKEYMQLANDLYREREGKQDQEYGVYTESQLRSDVNTDWIKEATRKGTISSHTVQYQSGGEYTKVLGSVGYFGQQGVLKNTNFNRFSGRINVDQKINDFIKTGVSMYAQRIKSNVQDYGGNILQSNVMLGILTYDPTVPVYNKDGSFGRPPGGRGDNPIANLLLRENDLTLDRLNGVAYLEVKPMKDLTGRINVGTEIGHAFTGSYLPRSSYQGSIDNGVANTTDVTSNRQLLDATLNYTKDFGEEHSFGALAGYAYEMTTTENRTIGVKNFSTDVFGFYNVGAASTITGVGSGKGEYKLISMFGRLNYSYLDKYLVTFTIRRDGSSKFGANHRWGYFPSGAFAWKMDKEEFIQNLNTFSSLKFRVGYGRTGNDQIPGNYPFLDGVEPTRVTYDGTTNTGGTHPSATSPGNDDLKWETTTQYNVGLDMGFLKNRILVTLDGYYKKTTDLLLARSLALYSGFTTQNANIGSLENRGIEVDVTSHNITGSKFTWDSRVNFSMNRNKVLDVGKTDIFLTSSKPQGFVSEEQFAVIRAGESLGSLFGYVYDGVIQEGETYTPQPSSLAGDPKFVDVNGDGIINSGDRTIIGSAMPKFIYGLTNTFNYRNFDLSIFFHGSVGNDLLNMSRMNLEWNRTTDALNRWTPTNTNTDIPRNGFYYMKHGGYINSHFIERASFLRMKNVTVGYTLHSRSKVINSARLYLAVENLFTLTKYSGWDPEVDTKAYESNPSQSNAAGTPKGGQTASGGSGLDFNSYPAMRTATIGINLNF